MLTKLLARYRALPQGGRWGIGLVAFLLAFNLLGLSLEAVYGGAEPCGVDRRRVGERSERGVPADELVSPNGRQLADRDPVASHEEALSGVEGSHHLAALVA